jgi:hypothetical protein
MSHFIYLWAIDLHSPVRHECAIGLTWSFMFGVPTWIFLPLIAFQQKSAFHPVIIKAMKGMAIIALVQFLFSMFVMA